MNLLKKILFKIKFVKLLTIFVTFSSSVQFCYATHIAGGQFEYTYISERPDPSNSSQTLYMYNVTYYYYFECLAGGGSVSGFNNLIGAPISQMVINASASEYVNVSNGSQTIDLSNILLLQSATSFPEGCSCDGGSVNGYAQVTFSGNVELSPSVWKFKLLDRNRNSVTSTTSLFSFYVESELNSILAPRNNSVKFSNPLILFPMINQNFIYDHGAYDIDGDVIEYEIITPKTNQFGTVNYETNYSNTNIFGSNGTSSFNNGTIIGQSNIIQTTILAVKVKEIRNGVQIGSVTRDIQLKVSSGTNVAPELSGINGGNSYLFNAYAGIQNCFNVISTDQDINQNLTLTSNDISIAFPSSTFNVNSNNTPLPTAEVCLTPLISDVGKTSCFTIISTDDACNTFIPPVPNGQTIKSYCVNILPFPIEIVEPCETCIGSFAPLPSLPGTESGRYLIGAWVKEEKAPNTKVDYDQPEIYIDFTLDDGVNPPSIATVGPFKPQGAIIDGWQRIEEELIIPELAVDMEIKLTTVGDDVLFDDIRFFPFDASMKTFVYDPINMRLAAELDERHYATFYEYDEEGKLVRIKKETEKGIMTIQETKSNSSKKNP